MQEKPELPDDEIVACLEQAYGLQVERIAFLALGADQGSAAYRCEARDGSVYFIKLRRGEFSLASLMVPKYLSDQGMAQVIPPLPTRSGSLWRPLAEFNLSLYPFVTGRNGFERPLSDSQWIEFGTALRKFHGTDFPVEITRGIPREDFSPRWREAVRKFLARIIKEAYHEPVAQETAAFLNSKTAETHDLVGRTEKLAARLSEQPPEFILCHADIHAWNLLIDEQGALFMVDWDTLIFAPKERDLMFVGGGLGGRGRSPQEEEALFYRGYGSTRVEPHALAYYRYERIVEDIAVFCEQIFSSEAGGKDREQALEYLKTNFDPNGVLVLARQSDKASLCE